MKFLKMTALTIVTGLVFTPAITFAGDMDQAQNKIEDAAGTVSQNAQEGWQKTKLESTFAMDSELSAYQIDTKVVGNKATLDGKVKSEAVKQLAEEKAKTVDGITEIENNLTVMSEEEVSAHENDGSIKQSMANATITASVKTQLIASDVPALDVNVDTDNGIVTLSGTVKSDAQAELAETIASETDNVVSVENDLEVDDKVAKR